MRDIRLLTQHLTQPAIHLVQSSSPSRSHFGGSARLPQNVDWPRLNGEPLGFIARLSLPELHRAYPIHWLPSDGALLFFYDWENQPWGFDPNDRGGAAVLHVSNLPEPISPPENGSNGAGPSLPHRNISFERVDVLPDYQRAQLNELNLTDEEFDEYCRLVDAPFQGKPKHQVSGFPAPVQGDEMELECQLVTNGLYCGDESGYRDTRAHGLRSGAANWRLLLQVDSDDDLDVMWGDLGLVYYWVEEQRARDGDFSNAWVILQCG
jgi:uncharacterized protein YwqG